MCPEPGHREWEAAPDLACRPAHRFRVPVMALIRLEEDLLTREPQSQSLRSGLILQEVPVLGPDRQVQAWALLRLPEPWRLERAGQAERAVDRNQSPSMCQIKLDLSVES
jgi:hypothetical protein